jgi:TolA-binding protein
MSLKNKQLELAGFMVAVISLMACSSNKVLEENPSLEKQILELQNAQNSIAGKIEDLNRQIEGLKEQLGSVSHPTGAAPNPAFSKSPVHSPPLPVEKISEGVVPLRDETRKGERGKVLTPAEKLYREVVIDTKKGDLVKAGKGVESMLKRFKDAPITNNALYFYAEGLYEKGDYTKSSEEFEKLYKLFPDGNKAVAALYMLALSYQKLGHPTEAQETFENILTVYPGSREALEAQQQIMNGTNKKEGSRE